MPRRFKELLEQWWRIWVLVGLLYAKALLQRLEDAACRRWQRESTTLEERQWAEHVAILTGTDEEQQAAREARRVQQVYVAELERRIGHERLREYIRTTRCLEGKPLPAWWWRHSAS